MPIEAPDCSQGPVLARRVLAGWPGDQPLAIVWNTPGPNGRPRIIAGAPNAWIARPDLALPPQPPQGRGGWVGCLAYDLGPQIEPAAAGTNLARAAPTLPAALWARIDHPVVIDPASGLVDRGGPLPPPGIHRPYAISRAASLSGHKHYVDSVTRALDLIAAGDIYQVNLAHALQAEFQGSARAAMSAMVGDSFPRCGCYLEHDLPGGRRIAILSASPELFLDVSPAPGSPHPGPDSVTRSGRVVRTEPMKGTRPGGEDPVALASNLKEQAELAMIVDLMRNDLGRVCRFGSIRVEQARRIESHGFGAHAVLQATGAVTGILDESATLRDLLHATFPPGSVTGAPKIRAMQIIDELEPVRRGLYCGSLGWLGDDGAARFNVAIRTAVIDGHAEPGARDGFRAGVLRYSVGAGIVADSDPESEWRETLIKAGPLRAMGVDIEDDRA